MSKWLLLLVVIGLGVTCWVNRDKISTWVGSMRGTAVVSAAATPHPATDSQAQAVKKYPSLGVQGSAFNQKFVQLYNVKRNAEPAFLAQADWPMQLADQAASEQGVVAAPPTPPPTQASSSVLNNRPSGFSAPATVPPTVQLPGLKGSALDQRPSSYQKNGR
jgi:hypothetical protein